MNNLINWDGINFDNAILPSKLCQKFGIKIDKFEIDKSKIMSFDNVLKNEEKTALTLYETRYTSEDEYSQRVTYISDIHLTHKFIQAGCESKEDVTYFIQEIVYRIASTAGKVLLIDGDVSSEYSIFELFVSMLAKKINKNTIVVFTLGNHELWGFPENSVSEITEKYRNLIEANGMYLLQNDLLISDTSNGVKIIKYDELSRMQDEQIKDSIRKARFVIYGGLGFSGYNKEFNATNGIYRNTVTRECEIIESKKFEKMYFRLSHLISSKNVIILSHTPKKDWCSNDDYENGYIYVSGHTHRNYFYDDGETRIYADNQVGYKNKNICLKNFLIDTEYDTFFDYEDGIYKITAQQYQDFYRGKNMPITFERKTNILYMLKREGYYCFIHASNNGLSILNGGTLKKLENKDIRYYYDNMDIMIDKIKSPLKKFGVYQENVSKVIKKIGGSGHIHGAIVDIDFYNHVYVNPLDMKLTGYWASDIVNKVVYPTIPELLEDKCPILYRRYKKVIEEIGGEQNNILTDNQSTNVAVMPEQYLDTDIYKASREIKKMQKLNSNILSSWYEHIVPESLTEGKYVTRKQIGQEKLPDSKEK